MALTDAMTEFENRRAYEFKIAELQDNGIPDGTVYISFDVNGLKQVNDSFGEVESWKGSKVGEISISFGVVSKKEFVDLGILELAKIEDERMYEAKSDFYNSKVKDRR